MSALSRLPHLLRVRPNGYDRLATTALTLGLGSLCCAPAGAQTLNVNLLPTDVIVGSQLLGTATSAAVALGGGATVAPDGTLRAPSYVVQGTIRGSVGDAFGATDQALSASAATIAAATTNLSDLRQTIIDGTIGLVQRDPTSGAVTIAPASAGTQINVAGLAGGRRLSGLAGGAVDTDAATLGQLRLSGGALVQGLGGGAALDPVTGTLTAPIYSVGGRLYGDVGAALAATNALSVQYVPDVNGVATAAIDLSGRGPGGPVALRGVVNGRLVIGSTDAVNGGQLLATNAAVADLSIAIGTGSTGLVRQDPTSRALTVGANTDGTSVSFVNGAGQARVLGGVAAGTVAAGSQEAINGGQFQAGLAATAAALGGGARVGTDGSLIGPRYDVQGRSYTNVGAALGALDTYSVAYDVDPTSGGRGQSLTLAGGDPNKPVLIRNVADGIVATDAANVGQVTRAKAESAAYTDSKARETLTAATTYTDQRMAPLQNQVAGFGSQLADLNRQIGDVRTEARRGAAIGLAAAALRFDDRPGKLSVAAGGGVWRGESAASFGLGYTLPDGSARVNATGVTAGRDFGIGAGASFTLN